MANNRVVHFEIPATEPEQLMKFYAELFGWRFNHAFEGHEYWTCETGADGPGINGAIMRRRHPQQPWMNYVDVSSIDETIAQATRLGATVALPRTAIPGVGAYAAIIDPQGNICGLWEHVRA